MFSNITKKEVFKNKGENSDLIRKSKRNGQTDPDVLEELLKELD